MGGIFQIFEKIVPSNWVFSMELVGLLVSQLIMIVIISVFTRACVSNKMSARYIWFEAGREFQA